MMRIMAAALSPLPALRRRSRLLVAIAASGGATTATATATAGHAGIESSRTCALTVGFGHGLAQVGIAGFVRVTITRVAITQVTVTQVTVTAVRILRAVVEGLRT
jgi:hypothetical protein